MVFSTVAISWTKQPERPVILVEGVNNTEKELSWLYRLDGETVQNIQFQRSKPGGGDLVTLASKLPNEGFTILEEKYKTEYRAELDNKLVLINVNNNEEFVYSIVVNYFGTDRVPRPFKDEVEVVVKGKVPTFLIDSLCF